MMKVLIMPVLAAVLFVSSGEGDPSAPGPLENVRFFNATTGMTGSGGFTTTGQFATGSALAVGQSECSTVDPGPTSFGFRRSEYGWYWAQRQRARTVEGQSVTAGGNFTVATTGSTTSPTLFLLDNDFSVSRCS